jgi:penicillin-binding protein 2
VTGKRRIRALLTVSWLVLGGLATRLYALQVLRHEELATRAEKRRRRVDWLEPRRGRILDRSGRVLAYDRPASDVVVELLELDPALELVPNLARATRFPKPQDPKDLSIAVEWVAGRFREAREEVRAGARAAQVAFAPDEPARVRLERLASRFPGLVTAPAPGGGFAVLAPASLLGVRDRALDRLAAATGLGADALRALVQAREDEVRAIKRPDRRHEAWNKPLVVAADVSFDIVARVEEASVAVPGIGVRRRCERRYPCGPLAVHFVGTVAPLRDEELEVERRAGRLVDENADAAGLLLGDVHELAEGSRLRDQPRGRTGLEARLDRELAGLPGARVVERDAADRSRLVLLDIPPRDGEDVTTTIDAEEQQAAEAALDESLAKHGELGAGGAAVLISLESGDVLALASGPRYDPNTLRRDFTALNANPAKPLVHRAASSVPPGSTFKILSAFAFFGEGGLPLDTEFACNHALVPGKKGFRCDDDHGAHVGLEVALARSCNVFFFRAADALGPDPLAAWADRAGFGQSVSSWFPLGRGRFPDRLWKVRRLEEAEHARDARAADLGRAESELSLSSPPDPREVGAVHEAASRFAHAETWRARFAKDLGYGPGELRNAAIGQGDVRATPIQVARLAGLVATGGRTPRARLLEKDEAAFDAIALSPRVLEVVRAGLVGCCTRGTASSLQDLDIAGKTGTAEREPGKPNYAWFAGYYPASSPEVAFACLLDTTLDHGGDVCAPMARKLVEAYARSRGEEPKRRH